MPGQTHFTETQVGAMIAEAIAKERERCAKIADEQAQSCSDGATDAGEIWVANRIAKAIREICLKCNSIRAGNQEHAPL